MRMLVESHSSCYCFSSFFFTAVNRNNSYNYKEVTRWTTKVLWSNYGKILFPLNIENVHWALVVVYLNLQQIHYYDSMNHSGAKFLDIVFKWLTDEMQHKQLSINIIDWKLLDTSDITFVPKQSNGFDCGIYTIVAADFICNDRPLQNGYSQSDMPAYRQKIANDILGGVITKK